MLRYTIIICWLLLASVGYGQSQAELEQRRLRLSEQISTTSQLLQRSRKSRDATLGRLEGVERQIAQREELLDILQLQIAHADSSVGRTERVMQSMQADIDTLAAEYGRMARAALRQNLLQGRFAYLLAAEGFQDAVRRAQYLKRYDEHRRRQLSLIQLTRDALARKLERLDDVRANKQMLYEEQLEQGVLLEAELSEKRGLLADLQGDAKRLRAELAQQNADKEALDATIGEIIAVASERSRRKAKSESDRRLAEAALEKATETVAEPARKNTTTIAPARTTNYASELSADFKSNRGRLPLPVDRGYVSKPYGKRAHATLSKVQINNNGVDISTDVGAAAKAIFDGEVVGIQVVPGYHTMVILQHGDYYSVYSNLTDVRVKPGARVGTAEILGIVATASSGTASELHFEIWRERETQNPVRWVRGL